MIVPVGLLPFRSCNCRVFAWQLFDADEANIFQLGKFLDAVLERFRHAEHACEVVCIEVGSQAELGIVPPSLKRKNGAEDRRFIPERQPCPE